MLKKIGLPVLALTAMMVLAPIPKATAGVRVGVVVGAPVYAYPAYPYPEAYPYGYPTYNAYPAYPYPAPYAYPYTYWRDHDRREDREHREHEWREHERHEWREHERHEWREHEGWGRGYRR